MGMSQKDIDRFWLTAAKAGDDDCWIWMGRCNARTGRAYFQVDRKRRIAARVAREIASGPIPPGANVLHSCDNVKCVNPAHLRTGSQKNNVADMVERGRAHWSAQDRCKHGHLFDEANTRLYGPRLACRQCRACQRIATAKYKLKKKASSASRES